MWFFKSDISETVKCLAKSISENPDDWVIDDYYISNKKNKDIKLWVANGWRYIMLNRNDMFTRAEKKYLNEAIKKYICKKLMRSKL
jgi:hypothetical protein